MAENTNYIGVAMGLDVTDLKAGLSEANKQIQLANSQFKAASSGMDDWTKSIEGVSAKVKQLDTVLKAQKSKLAGLTAEYEKVAKEQGEGSEAARRLKVQINNQQAIVNKTEKEFKNYSETLKQAEAGTIDLAEASLKSGKAVKQMGDNADEASGKMDGFSGVAKGIVGGIAAIGTAAVGAVAGFLSLASSTREARENFNKLEAGFTTAGHSAEAATQTYKDLYGILGDEGQATEAAAHLAQLAKSEEDLATWTNIATGVYATFGDSLPIENLTEAANETAKTGKITGGLADALNWAGESEEEFQAKLDAASSEQERQALITETLNGLYSEQSTKFKELNGDIMSAREADAALTQAMSELGAVTEPILTTLKQLAADLLTEMQPFIAVIGEGLTGVLNGTAGAADTLAQGLGGLLSSLLEKLVSAIPTVLETVVSLISTLLPQVISTLAGFLPILIQTLAAQLPILLQAVISGVSQIFTSVGAMLPELIPIAIDAILMLAETLLDNIDQIIDAGISLLVGLADGLIKALPLLISKIPVIIEKLVGALARNIPNLLASGIKLLLGLRQGIMEAIPQLLLSIPEIIKSIVKGLIDGIPDLLSAGKDMLEGLFEGFLDPTVIWKKVKSLGKSIVDAAKSFFGIESPSRLMRDEIGEYLGEGVGVGMLDSMPKVKRNLAQFGNFITDNLGDIKSGLSLGVSGVGAYSGANVGGRSVVINAGTNITYNGNLSLKEIKQREREQYVNIKTQLRAEGLV